MRPANILVVDDEPSVRTYLQTMLEVSDYRVETVGGGNSALQRVRTGPAPDLVILDVLMPDLDGLQTLEAMNEIQPGLKVVMLSCVSDTRKVAQAIRLGAVDYLTKPFQRAELEAVLQRYAGTTQVFRESGPRDHHVEELGDDQFFVAASAPMKSLRARAEQIAQSPLPVLLLGESGTGKDVVARLIHRLSPRSQYTFLKVNCAALPSELLESELFGYEAGAFTGAARSKPGKFELCHRGTIFLDEIGEMPTELQAKLLHVIQDQEFSRLGSRSTVKVDVRILAATNLDVREALKARKFREDLYYRLNALTLTLPPLRERREELPLLLRHFMSQFSARYARPALPLSPSLIDACMKHSWPGNLRELENLIKRYLILGDESSLRNELEAEIRASGSQTSALEPTDEHSLGDLKSLLRSLKGGTEMQVIAKALEQTKGNRKKASKLLNISYRALLYKVRQYGLG